MNARPGIVERLILSWSVQSEGHEEDDPLCGELTRELADVIPRSLLAILQAEPQRHREAIDDMVRGHLGLPTAVATGSSRDIGGPVQVAPPTPKPPLVAIPAPVLSPDSVSQPVPASHEGFLSPLAPEESSPHSPRASGASLHQSGSGNVQFATGNIGGGFNFSSGGPPAGAKRLEPPQADDLPDPDSPIRILFLGANPDDSSRLRLDREVREIDRVLASAALGHRFQLQQKWAVRASELQSHLLRCKPQILHFSGHGSRTAGIVLEGEDGKSRLVNGSQLARLLGQFNQNLRCVVLNACYSEEQAHAIAQEIDCVVGMATAVADLAAIRFAAVFYEALAYGSDVRAAFDLARADIMVGELGQDAVPQLVVRRRAAETIRFAPPARK